MDGNQGRLGAMNLGPFVGVDLRLSPTVYISPLSCWRARKVIQTKLHVGYRVVPVTYSADRWCPSILCLIDTHNDAIPSHAHTMEVIISLLNTVLHCGFNKEITCTGHLPIHSLRVSDWRARITIKHVVNELTVVTLYMRLIVLPASIVYTYTFVACCSPVIQVNCAAMTTTHGAIRPLNYIRAADLRQHMTSCPSEFARRSTAL